MDILDMAKQLGMAIEESEEFKNLEQAEKIQNNDEEAQKRIGEYNLVRLQLMQKMHSGSMTNEEIEKIQSEMKAEFDKLSEYEIIKNYLEARDKFDTMYTKVKNIIDFYASGEQSGGCSGSCETCGGCH